jgi:hypothetical protein
MSAPVIVTLDSVHVDYADNVAAVRQRRAGWDAWGNEAPAEAS